MHTAVLVAGAVIALLCIVGFFRSLFSDRPGGDSDEGHGFQPGGTPPPDHSPFDGSGSA
jgi:hypothetical protein